MSKDVWNEMDKIVRPELLPSQQEFNETSEVDVDLVEDSEENHVTNESGKLCESDVISPKDVLFHRIARSVFPFKRKYFALHTLGLEESEYDEIITETIGAEDRNYEVVFENDLYFKEF